MVPAPGSIALYTGKVCYKEATLYNYIFAKTSHVHVSCSCCSLMLSDERLEQCQEEVITIMKLGSMENF